MAYFPFFSDISGKLCLIVGGGKVALRKAEKLLPFEPKIRAVSPEFCPGFEELPVERIRREFRDSDLEGAFMVISATGDEALGARIFGLCSERRIPVNTVDDKAKCSFIFPAIVRSGCVTAGISTGGASPVFARYLAEKSRELLSGRLTEIGLLLAQVRPGILERFPTEIARKLAMEAILERCLTGEELPDSAQIEEILEEAEG
ncbi:MAG: bifunctional precorrin-2 dehydrogenase/sirohydrochlorin ferrochelatase [Ruminococcus sp.]|nr:bifunctional precorrin-2 dehydrogenase/sirohydrochlorin ferrochelatase [Ruminococcus sp.]